MSRLSSARSLLDVMVDTVHRNDAEHRRGFHQSGDSFEWVSEATLLAQSFEYAAQLLESGVRPGDRCLLLGLGGRAQVTAFFAVVAAGATPMVLASVKGLSGQQNRVLPAVQDWVRALGARTVVISDESTIALLAPDGAGPSPALALVAPSSRAFASFATRSKPPFEGMRATDILHLQATSASTGRHRAVAISHGNVLANVEGIRIASAAGESEVVCSWLPLYHDMGLVGTELFSLCHQYTLVSMAPYDFLKRPLRWLKTISGERCTLSPAPNFAYEYTAENVSAEEAAHLDLSCWKVAYNGAEPIRGRGIDLFAERFRAAGFDAAAIRPCYGLAEATLAVTMTNVARVPRSLSVDGRGLTIASKLQLEGDSDRGSATAPAAYSRVFSVGRPLPGVHVGLCDESGAVLSGDLVLGEVTVAGPALAAGYLASPGELTALGVPFRTGDLGFFRDGELYLIERIKNVVIHNGENYAASILEEQLARRLQISSGRVAVFESSITAGSREIVALVESESAGDAETLLGRLPELGGAELPLDRVFVVKKRSIPRTTSGKKRHFMCRTMLKQGEIVPLAELLLGGSPAAPSAKQPPLN